MVSLLLMADKIKKLIILKMKQNIICKIFSKLFWHLNFRPSFTFFVFVLFFFVFFYNFFCNIEMKNNDWFFWIFVIWSEKIKWMKKGGQKLEINKFSLFHPGVWPCRLFDIVAQLTRCMDKLDTNCRTCQKMFPLISSACYVEQKLRLVVM